MSEHVQSASYDDREEQVERGQTGIRIALTVLFALIATVLEGALSLIVVFSLLWTLITKRPPSPRLRDLANRIIAYYYRIGRYLTYNDSEVPFPFSEFPAPLEEDAWSADDRESESLGLPVWDEPDEGDEEPRGHG